jgi:hypothetical protein
VAVYSFIHINNYIALVSSSQEEFRWKKTTRGLSFFILLTPPAFSLFSRQVRFATIRNDRFVCCARPYSFFSDDGHFAACDSFLDVPFLFSSSIFSLRLRACAGGRFIFGGLVGKDF